MKKEDLKEIVKTELKNTINFLHDELEMDVNSFDWGTEIKEADLKEPEDIKNHIQDMIKSFLKEITS